MRDASSWRQRRGAAAPSGSFFRRLDFDSSHSEESSAGESMKGKYRFLLGVVLLVAAAASAAPPSPSSPEAGEEGTARFDPVARTRAYLSKVPPEKKARSDAYFEGGYWLHLWSFLYGVMVAWLLLALGWSAS